MQPLWQGISLIVVDEFTRAAHGELILHADVARKLRHHAGTAQFAYKQQTQIP